MSFVQRFRARPPIRTTDIIVRAYQLAAETGNLDEVRLKLRREGYANVDAHLSGARIKADLKKQFAKKAALVPATEA